MSVWRRAGRWLLRLVLIAVLALIALQLWYFGWIALWKWVNPGQTAFMAHELSRLQQIDPQARLRQTWVDYAQVSLHLKRAVVTAEDARFTEHEGVDWEAIQRAFENNLKRGRKIRGGSTISQQLAKNLFLSNERSYVRKAQELVITYMIEWVWDKRRILEVYLNVAEWGNGVFGAEAAARHYYGRSAMQLDPWQSARLAAMLPRPKFYDRNRGSSYLAGRTGAIQRYMGDAAIP